MNIPHCVWCIKQFSLKLVAQLSAAEWTTCGKVINFMAQRYACIKTTYIHEQQRYRDVMCEPDKADCTLPLWKYDFVFVLTLYDVLDLRGQSYSSNPGNPGNVSKVH